MVDEFGTWKRGFRTLIVGVLHRVVGAQVHPARSSNSRLRLFFSRIPWLRLVARAATCLRLLQRISVLVAVMPLWKRFQAELLPEWRKECVDYKVSSLFLLHANAVSCVEVCDFSCFLLPVWT